MRPVLASTALCIIVSVMSEAMLTARAAPPAPPASAADNDAAARHLKRTACLKSARGKKLVGAQRTAYVKECMGPAASPPVATRDP